MRWQSWILLFFGFVLCAIWWHLGRVHSFAPPSPPVHPGPIASSQPAARPTASSSQAHPGPECFSWRLANTDRSPGELARNDKAILLENALLDTEQPLALPIPEALRSRTDPGTYIVQSRSVLDNAFRALLSQAGAVVTAYIPNNALLVRASAEIARQLETSPLVQAVIPYEPYYKLKPSLLKLVLADMGKDAFHRVPKVAENATTEDHVLARDAGLSAVLPTTSDLLADGRQFPLSPGERAGVRGI